jgi:hypothetical protein
MHFNKHIFLAMIVAAAGMSSAASADESTSRALFFMAQAQYAAQSQMGYAPVAESDDDGCCAYGASDTLTTRYTGINQQIAQLAAAIQAPVTPIVRSPADLARGAY